MATRSEQLQIRVTPQEKETIRRLADSAGLDLSGYVLGRALPSNRLRFEAVIRALGEGGDHRYALAGLNDLLTGLAPVAFPDAVEQADVTALSPLLCNYVAAMVEQAANDKKVPSPEWVRQIEPLSSPYFATGLRSLRPYLMAVSPVPFRRRNLFVDAALGDRV